MATVEKGSAQEAELLKVVDWHVNDYAERFGEGYSPDSRKDFVVSQLPEYLQRLNILYQPGDNNPAMWEYFNQTAEDPFYRQITEDLLPGVARVIGGSFPGGPKDGKLTVVETAQEVFASWMAREQGI